MRIGLNLLYLIPGLVGGTEAYARSLTEHLFRHDNHEYVVFVNSNTSRSDLDLPSKVKMVQVAVDARSRGRRYFVEQTILPQLAKAEKVDLLHSMGYVAPIWTELPSVVTIHDVNFKHVIMPLTKRITLGWFMRRAAQRARAVLTVSEFSKREICEFFGIDAGKVWVTHNAPNEDVFYQSENPTRRREGQPYVLVLSSPSPHKNIDGFIKAFQIISRHLPEVRLRIAGHLAPTISVPPSLADRVDVLGYVSRAALLDLYRSAACFVMPSLYEGFGIPVIEAMALGTPVACSSSAALPEVGGDAAVYFDPQNPDQMASTVLRVLTDIQLAQNLSRKGHERAGAFSWDDSAARTVQVYEVAAEGLRGE